MTQWGGTRQVITMRKCINIFLPRCRSPKFQQKNGLASRLYQPQEAQWHHHYNIFPLYYAHPNLYILTAKHRFHLAGILGFEHAPTYHIIHTINVYFCPTTFSLPSAYRYITSYRTKIFLFSLTIYFGPFHLATRWNPLYLWLFLFYFSYVALLEAVPPTTSLHLKLSPF